jgi:DNA (cytosine-5)-methyltransferase 1
VLNTAKLLSIKEHRGAPRLWIEGNAPLKSGFEPGRHYCVERKGNTLVLSLNETGVRKVSKKTSTKGDIPVLDLNSVKDLELFKNQKVVRVVFGPGCVVISATASEKRRQTRLERVRNKLLKNEPLACGGICAGGGVLSHAIHAGFKQAGVAARTAFHNEIRDELAEHAQTVNDALDADTQMLVMPLQELAFDDEVTRRVGEVDIIELGLPCSGASVAGRSKLSLGIPEEHPDVGHLVVGALALLAKLNPAVAIFENVVPYAKSASAVLIRQQLRDMGYDCHEREFFGPDWGALEARRRWCLVAVTRGIDFDLEALTPAPFVPQTIGDILDPLETVEDRWSEMTGLKAKQERDIAAGKGFRMQIVGPDQTTCPTLTKGITKNRSTDPKFPHPTNPDLLRIPTAREHARCKGVPERLIDSLAQTTAHELLGQGIVYQPFLQLGAYVANTLKAWAKASEALGESLVGATAVRAAG